ncbi:MAG: aldo/keto reductase, partial [Candidatus Hodarchaeales archaeon]
MDKNVNRLEKNGVYLNTIGLGIEHFAKGVRNLNISREENTKLILEEAFKLGITHFDLVFNLPYFFDVFSNFIQDKREKISFTAHLGNVFDEKKQTNRKTRSLNLIQNSFTSMMNKLNTDYVDIALLQFITSTDDYQNVIKKGNLDYVKELKKDGVAKAIGISGHNPTLLTKIIEQGDYDVVMFTLNFATGFLESTRKFIEMCKKKEVALIAIKNLLRGKVFTRRKTNYPGYICCGKKFSLKLDEPATASQCFHYALDLGADAIVFGVKSVDELINNIKSYQSSKEVEYSNIMSIFEHL